MTIDFLGYERIDHAPYSPNLAPFDFAIFPRLKVICAERDIDLQELRMAVRSAVFKYEKVWFGEVYKQWVERHRKCVQVGGGYFEKL